MCRFCRLFPASLCQARRVEVCDGLRHIISGMRKCARAALRAHQYRVRMHLRRRVRNCFACQKPIVARMRGDPCPARPPTPAAHIEPFFHDLTHRLALPHEHTPLQVQEMRDREFGGTEWEDTPIIQASYDDVRSAGSASMCVNAFPLEHVRRCVVEFAYKIHYRSGGICPKVSHTRARWFVRTFVEVSTA